MTAGARQGRPFCALPFSRPADGGGGRPSAPRPCRRSGGRPAKHLRNPLQSAAEQPQAGGEPLPCALPVMGREMIPPRRGTGRRLPFLPQDTKSPPAGERRAGRTKAEPESYSLFCLMTCLARAVSGALGYLRVSSVRRCLAADFLLSWRKDMPCFR